jgi:hypothetical protein
MKTKIFVFLFCSLIFLMRSVSAQPPGCDSLVPVFNIDFTAATSDSTWISSTVTRNGNCCGTIAPDRCVLFVITTGTSTIGLTFGFTCPLPSGSNNFQVDCDPPIVYGDTAWISIPGIHYLTYCKPGNLPCEYSVTSITPQTPNSVDENKNSHVALLQDATGSHFLDLNLFSSSAFTLNIFSVDGKKISEKHYSLGSGNHRIPVYANEPDAGIYLCRVVGEGINKSFKFIK